MATTELYEIEAWLGDAADELTPGNIRWLRAEADRIQERWPDDAAAREGALTAAFRSLVEDHEVLLGEAADAVRTERRALADAMVMAQQVAVIAVYAGMSEAAVSRQLGVDRMTVRAWLGKR